MAERSKAAVLKTAVRGTVPGVRIPLPPPRLTSFAASGASGLQALRGSRRSGHESLSLRHLTRLFSFVQRLIEIGAASARLEMPQARHEFVQPGHALLGSLQFARRIVEYGATGGRRLMIRRQRLFGQRAQRISLRQHVEGFLGDSPRKSMSAMWGSVTDPTSYQAFQHFITHAPRGCGEGLASPAGGAWKVRGLRRVTSRAPGT